MKKLLSLLLFVVLIFTSLGSAFALEAETSYFETESSELQNFSREIPVTFFKDHTPIVGEEAHNQLLSENPSPLSRDSIAVMVRINSVNGILSYGYRVTSMTGSPPNRLTVTVTPQVNKHKNNAYSQYGSHTWYVNTNNLRVGYQETVDTYIGGTNYWRFQMSGEIYYTGSTNFPVNYPDYGHSLMNKKGEVYPNICSSVVPQCVPEPGSLNWVKAPRDSYNKLRSAWDNTVRNKQWRPYIQQKYSLGANFNWDGIEGHHVHPLDLGGTNGPFDSIIPLRKSEHTPFTSWFVNY
ncbi:hypothetical protein [Paenibacillus agilis]|uniref:HNH endonuclease n=1 Tax=Paenibacillus agilis TaxID=3020863 RepID=A0A559ICY2_9BACL|nr:hypothetical protein [Paenibacillus agilis]TVX85532.1 hypothetical protein FPZ44_24555 [Paenibacillus agilis]